VLPAALPDGATVRKISGEDSEVFAVALAAGFGLPEDVARLMSRPGLLDAPGITGFVLDLRGEAVATGINVLAGHYAGMFSGSVPPGHRGNGYYRALVTARLADAVARGAGMMTGFGNVFVLAAFQRWAPPALPCPALLGRATGVLMLGVFGVSPVVVAPGAIFTR
jgi:hypothetical protein